MHKLNFIYQFNYFNAIIYFCMVFTSISKDRLCKTVGLYFIYFSSILSIKNIDGDGQTVPTNAYKHLTKINNCIKSMKYYKQNIYKVCVYCSYFKKAKMYKTHLRNMNC